MLNRLYRVMWTYTNNYQPTVKLITQTANGSRDSKRYDKALTPYRRLLAWTGKTGTDRARLTAENRPLNPAD